MTASKKLVVEFNGPLEERLGVDGEDDAHEVGPPESPVHDSHPGRKRICRNLREPVNRRTRWGRKHDDLGRTPGHRGHEAATPAAALLSFAASPEEEAPAVAV